MTKTAFLAAYRADLIANYSWANDMDRLERFMASAARTITSVAMTWNVSGSDSAVRAWRTIGCKGRPTYKGLRALAD